MYDNMPKKTYRDLPTDYAVCAHDACPQAATCLHHIAYGQLMATAEYLRIINPSRCTPTAACPYYRNNAPVTYARGFTNFQNKMFPPQYKAFVAKCTSRWSRNPYFERRRGDSLLSPAEQEFVLQALRDCGVTEEMTFDGYEELINWYD